MIQSLHPEGSGLLVYQPNEEQLNRIYQKGIIQFFVLTEFKKISLPYYQLITQSDFERIYSYEMGPQYLGTILKLSDLDVEIPNSFQSIQFIDLEMSNLKNTKAFLKKVNANETVKIFLSFHPKAKIKSINEVIEWIPSQTEFKNIKFFKKPYDQDSSDWQGWSSFEEDLPCHFEQGQFLEALKYSIIIPHYNSEHFLVNVIHHLSRVKDSDQIEVIVVDDGSKNQSLEYIKYCAGLRFPKLNFRLYAWPDKPNLKSKKKIFRAGLSRNWGAYQAKADRLLFLDSDMLVPQNLLEKLDECFNVSDVTQFKRLHIPAILSHELTEYESMKKSPDLFIEESQYWGQLFSASHWMNLPDFWKMTCTYALAIQKKTFFEVGRFRREFIEYGFEDTDLGYRLWKKNFSFHLEQTALLHLTQSQENTQSVLFKFNKMRRIQNMAALFYKLNLDSSIFRLFRSFY